MSGQLIISCVVEGHGEVEALPVLIRRVVAEHDPNLHVVIPRPNRQPRHRLVQADELSRAVELAALRVGDQSGGVLVLLDADDDCPADLASRVFTSSCRSSRGRTVRVVAADREFESWFLSAAASLAGVRGLPDDLADHPAPERPRDAKGWLREQMLSGRTYSPTVDQPALAARLDISRARKRSRSFDKLVRSVLALTDDRDATTR